MKKTILFVLLEQYADWEAAYLSSALHMLGEEQFYIKTVSLTTECVQSIGGFHILPDYDLQSVPDAYTALILIGGMSWRRDAAKAVAPLVQDAVANQKIVGAICDASAFLGTLGVLNTVKHTSNDLHGLQQWAGSNYTGENNYVLQQAVRDQNIITANGTAALEFAREVMLALHTIPEKKILQWYEFHKLGYYQAKFPEM